MTHKGIPAGFSEATELTRQGRLLEATALIQRMLGRSPAFAQGAPGEARASSDVIDVDCVEVEERPRPVLPEWLRRDPTVEEPPAQAKRHDGRPGEFISGLYTNQAGARPYKLYIPSAYAGQPLPLVVMLHGCTQTPDDFANGTRMNAIADARPFFVLYPEQTPAANQSRCWNWFKRSDQRREQGEPAILAGMTREMITRYGIASDRIFVAGLSAGGAMAAVLGSAYPDLYAAVGVHSGLACGSAHDLPSALAAMRGHPPPARRTGASVSAVPATPTIVFHGDRDRTVHPRNGEHVAAQSAQQSGIAGADATTERGQAPGGHPYTRTIHRDSQGRIVLEHWLVHGAGHAWFGGSTRGSHVDPRAPDAAREMVRFFYETRRLT